MPSLFATLWQDKALPQLARVLGEPLVLYPGGDRRRERTLADCIVDRAVGWNAGGFDPRADELPGAQRETRRWVWVSILDAEAVGIKDSTRVAAADLLSFDGHVWTIDRPVEADGLPEGYTTYRVYRDMRSVTTPRGA